MGENQKKKMTLFLQPPPLESSRLASKIWIDHSIKYSDVAHAYLTSSYGNGSEPLACFEVEGKTIFVQAMHAVQAVPMGGEESTTLIIDFPLTSVELVATAMAFMRDWEFSLRF